MATRIVCVFPGRGAQAVGMGKDLWEADDAVKALYQEANDVLGYDLQRLCFEGPEDELRLTQHAQPAILVHSIATWTLVSRHGLRPVLLAGHSLGEYSALVASGVLRFAEAVHLVHKRGMFMQEAVPSGAGSMAALLGVARQDVEALCAELGGDGVLQPANYNDPGQIVIAGETVRVQAAVDAVKARRLGKPVLLNVTAAPHPAPAAVQDLLVQQVCAPVRWEDAMRYAVTHGCDALLEVGPGRALSGMMKRIAPQVEILALDEFLRL